MAAAESALRRAISLDRLLATAHGTLGSVYMMRGDFAAAEAAGRRSIELAPGNSEMHAVLAETLLLRGQFQEAVAQSEQAIRLSPRHPSWYLIWGAWGHVFLGNPEAGLTAARHMLSIAESAPMAAVACDSMAFALAESGQSEEARAAIAEGLRRLPGHGLAWHRRASAFENPANFERLARRLTEAGLPE